LTEPKYVSKYTKISGKNGKFTFVTSEFAEFPITTFANIKNSNWSYAQIFFQARGFSIRLLLFGQMELDHPQKS
jgi:hypothetical protein